MTSIVHLKNKNTGTIYVYESEGYWDKEKQQARNRRICIGKLAPETGELIPSKRMRKREKFASLPPLCGDAGHQSSANAVFAELRTSLTKLAKNSASLKI